MHIRELQSEDLDAIYEWFQQDPLLWQKMGFPHAIDLNDLAVHMIQLGYEELQGKALQRIVCDDDGPVAMVSVRPKYGRTGVGHITIAPWKRGHGREIAHLALAAAKEAGVDQVIAPPSTVVPWMTWGRMLQQLGFTPYTVGVA